MFTCLYSIWDWLEAPPVFTANMESKKLQQLQQANSHLAPQKKMPLAYQTTVGDYRTATHSPVFQQNLLQYHQSNVNIPNYQSPTSSGSQITPVDIQPHTHMLLKSNAQSQYQQQQYGSIGGEQLYQSPTSDRYYQMAPRNQNQALAPLGNHQHSHPVTALQAQYQQLQQAKMQAQIQTQNEAIVQQQRTFAMRQQLNPPVPQSHFHMSQSSSMMSSPIQNQQQQQQQQKQQQQQYQQQLQQQHQQNQQQLQSTTQLQSNAHHRIAAPPSTLNLSSQFQPAQGPLKINNNNNEARVHHQQQQQQQQQHQQHYQDTLNQSIYQQQQQQLPQKQHAQQHPPVQTKFHSGKVDTSVSSGLTGGINEPSPVYIQQNHPGHVVNQACQTQISGAAGNKTKTPSSEEGSSVKSPAHESPSHQQLDRKKSSGSVQALKLPLTKRPPSSPVTISGWLYKQGSEGLKVWRKRWFVLSEYCLYYYKGPEEEKVLGAILLPSYRISACLPEDKIYRKFAFKCEHTNMRTYWLAAENCETMIQWVKALTAAALMQASSESSDQTSQPSVSSLNHSGENSDSGIHTFHSQQGKMGISGVAQGPVTPASDNGAQPLYANAPPKPRRINDGGYSSPSPENSIERADKIGLERQQILSQQQLSRRSGGVMSPTLQQMQRSQQHAIYDTQTGNVTSTVRTNDPLTGQFHQMSLDGQKKSPFYMTEYGKHVSAYNQALELEEQLIRSQSQRLGEELYGERELYMQKIIQQRYPNQIGHGGVMTYPNAERRTPDAYGRSKNKSLSDYEDIYNVAQQTKLAQAQQPTSAELGAYRRPMSPPTYDSTKHVPPMPSRYTPNHLEPSPSHVSLRSRPSVASISRPHSADFLEYEARAEAAAAAAIKPDPIRAPRPKSSLDINRTPDSYYYSEASYAEKMRQSALYLQKPQSQQPQQQQPPTTPSGGSSYNRSHDVSPYLNGTNNGGMNTIGYENPYERIHKRHELLNETLNHGAQSVPRMSRSTTNTSIQSVGSGGNNSHPKEYQHRSQYMQSNEQFLRSASARLPKRGDDDTNTISIAGNAGSPSNTIDGERKREESMKRLLEWKQRMLQSPLTRKGIQQPGSASVMAKLGSNPNILIGSGSGIQRSRSETHANAGGGGYTSYSSDDEASISVRNVRNLPQVNLTVKPDPSDPINFEHNSTNCEQLYYGTSNNIDPKFAAISTPTDRNYYSAGNGRDIHSSNYDIHNSYRDRDNYYPLRKSGSRAEIDILERETSSQIRNLDMSAGDLLSRTHEELVLLLIQLRRQNSQTARAIEQCCTDIHEVQNRIRTTDGLTRAESIQRLDYLKQHLLDLEKQYEKSKPLVNLVDNMVKLGSLYRSNENTSRQILQPQRPESVTLDRLEFNQRMQERRMLQEEQKQWDRLSPNHNELQSKVRQLYQLDQLLQEESGTLHSLQKDKEDLERALGGLRARLQNTTGPPLALEAAKKQQHILERELSRVHQLLAENSKKLEQTVAGNARLEQELLVLRQKLQATKGSRGSQGALGSTQSGNDSIQYASTTTALLESELKRVQELVGDMQRQRQELSSAVKQLTENSNRLYQEIGNKDNIGVSTSPSHIKKRNQTACWIETDLDSMVCVDRTVYENSNLSTPLYVDTSITNSNANPMNCSTSSKLSESDGKSIRSYRYPDSDGPETSGMESDEFLETNPFANLTNQEKQEIKTVRIVKRESERRHRDRERNTTNTSCLNLDHVQEEEMQDELFARSKSLPRSYNDIYENNYSALPSSKDIAKTSVPHSTQSLNSNQPSSSSSSSYQAKYSDYYGSVSSNGITNPYPVSLTDKNSNYSYGQAHYQGKPIKNGIMPSTAIPSSTNRHESSQARTHHQQPQSYALRAKTESMQSLTKSISDLTPVFHSEAARQIISEMSAGSASEDNNTEKVPASHKHKRAVPREKRRHYTAPNNVNKTAMETVQTENDMNRNNTNWRARDDLDMEVALRPRINAPDVVRSALGHGEKISENTIDKLFGAPSKIVIPERYIPEKTPELSPEEKKRRQEKVESIKKMLAEAPMNSSNDTESQPPSKINAEKKQREHLLQLNQILAQQVMQMSKIVAGNPIQSNQK